MTTKCSFNVLRSWLIHRPASLSFYKYTVSPLASTVYVPAGMQLYINLYVTELIQSASQCKEDKKKKMERTRKVKVKIKSNSTPTFRLFDAYWERSTLTTGRYHVYPDGTVIKYLLYQTSRQIIQYKLRHYIRFGNVSGRYESQNNQFWVQRRTEDGGVSSGPSLQRSVQRRRVMPKQKELQ